MRLLPPVTTVMLGSSQELPLSGLVVVIGPNSSGKTQLLRDIYAAACGEARAMVVATSATIRALPAYDDLLSHLKHRGELDTPIAPGGPARIRRRGHLLGTNKSAGGEWTSDTFANLYQRAMASAGKTLPRSLPQDEGRALFGSLSLAAMFLEDRLTLLAPTNSFSVRVAAPHNILQQLHVDRRAKQILATELQRAFGIGVWLDATDANQLALLISRTGGVPPADERVEPEEMLKYPPLVQEGDGVRSYAAVCLTLLLSQRELCLIDEPELCLHPPQQFSIGAYIGQHATAKRRCTLVATHSGDVLRGILASRTPVTLVRLTRDEDEFSAHLVDSASLRSALGRPMLRSRMILDGALSHGVVLCESDGDRLVYAATLQSLRPQGFDVAFVPVGGAGAFPEALGFYRKLAVPVCVAADIDVLLDRALVGSLLERLGCARARIDHILVEVSAVTHALRSHLSGVDLPGVKQRLHELSTGTPTPENDGADELRRELTTLARLLRPFGSLADAGLGSVGGDLNTRIQSLLVILEEEGVFLVPCGQLESWEPELLGDIGKQRKWRWAIEAAARIEEAGTQEAELWRFVGRILNYLRSTRSRTTLAPPNLG